MMRTWLTILLLALNGAGTSALDTYYGAHHNELISAVWKPDGTQFATFGVSAGRPDQAIVTVWRDNDGLRLLMNVAQARS